MRNARPERPCIGVTGPARGGALAWYWTSVAIRLEGGLPLRLTPAQPLPEQLDGLVIGGGSDVGTSVPEVGMPPQEASARRSPQWALRHMSALRQAVDQARHNARDLARGALVRRSAPPDPERDAAEMALIRHAEAERLPILGICRGAQLLNVCAGGTLHRDLSEFYPAPMSMMWTPRAKKRVAIVPSSRLAAVMQTVDCAVNSLHNHAVAELGKGLVVAARDQSGVIQAIESPGARFCIGVQWHPEYLLQYPEQRRLFAALIRAACERGGGRPVHVQSQVPAVSRR